MKYVQATELRKRALAAGLGRASAGVLGILGYWAQVPGGVKKGPGKSWKWRTYKEMGDELGYADVTIQRAVSDLRNRKLIATLRMFNPSKSGQTVNGFRLTGDGYTVIGLPVPIGAHVFPEPIESTAVQHAKLVDGDGHGEWSQVQLNSKKHQGDSESCSGEEKSQVTKQATKTQTEEPDRPATLQEVAAMLGKVV